MLPNVWDPVSARVYRISCGSGLHRQVTDLMRELAAGIAADRATLAAT